MNTHDDRIDSQITGQLQALVLLSTRAYFAKQRDDDHDMMQALRQCKRSIADLQRLTRPESAQRHDDSDSAIADRSSATVIQMLQSGSSFPAIATALSLPYKTVRRIARVAGVRSKWERK